MVRRPPRSTRMTHSFPTRRSSDLCWMYVIHLGEHVLRPPSPVAALGASSISTTACRAEAARRRMTVRARAPDPPRSEEHTSELQSLMRISYAVFCLKKQKYKSTVANDLSSKHTNRSIK